MLAVRSRSAFLACCCCTDCPSAFSSLKAFAKGNDKGKRKELSPQDAALLIQMTYRAHLAHRSQVLRCLRDLAVAKAKLKEIRSLFYNISYRRRLANDQEERQRFYEKVIVLLITVDALEVSCLYIAVSLATLLGCKFSRCTVEVKFCKHNHVSLCFLP